MPTDNPSREPSRPVTMEGDCKMPGCGTWIGGRTGYCSAHEAVVIRQFEVLMVAAQELLDMVKESGLNPALDRRLAALEAALKSVGS